MAAREQFGGESVLAGNILIRQRSFSVKPGKNVGIGKDNTLFAMIDGTVQFKKKHDNNHKESHILTVLEKV